MTNEPGPLHVSLALAELIRVRGLAAPQGDAQLQTVWDRAAGRDVASLTRVGGLSRGTLQVMVANPALLAELNGFHKAGLLQKLQQSHPEYKFKQLKFKLQSNLKRRELTDPSPPYEGGATPTPPLGKGGFGGVRRSD